MVCPVEIMSSTNTTVFPFTGFSILTIVRTVSELYRFLSSSFTFYENNSWNVWDPNHIGQENVINNKQDDYRMEVGYDRNGNIKKMFRNAYDIGNPHN